MWVWGRAQWGSPKLGPPSSCTEPPESSPDPTFCALAQSSSLDWDFTWAACFWSLGKWRWQLCHFPLESVIRRGWIGAESWELLHLLVAPESELPGNVDLLYYRFFICLFAFWFWLEMSCGLGSNVEGWPRLPGMFCGSLEGKTPGSWSFDFFP